MLFGAIIGVITVELILLLVALMSGSVEADIPTIFSLWTAVVGAPFGIFLSVIYWLIDKLINMLTSEKAELQICSLRGDADRD